MSKALAWSECRHRVIAGLGQDMMDKVGYDWKRKSRQARLAQTHKKDPSCEDCMKPVRAVQGCIR